MLRFLTKSMALGLLLAGTSTTLAWSGLGPIGGGGDAYQTAEIGYDLPGDIGAPKNLGEEYRWVLPTVFYAYNQSFLDYFGSNGVWAVDEAIKVLNAVTNVNLYTPNLSEWPMEASGVNYRAQAAFLFDLKSYALSLTLEELGLAQPDRWTWCLTFRETLPGAQCPAMEYHVTMRNFDPVTWEPTPYVNDTLWTYQIFEICSGNNPLADAVEQLVDPLAPAFSSVASYGAVTYGGYWTGLTRDDVGGLRYLWRTNNVNIEPAANNSLVYATNTQPQLLYTSNLTLFAQQALTNDAATLAGLYPGLQIINSSNYFVNVPQTNVTAVLTNSPYDPVGTIPNPVLITNYTTNILTYYEHQFGNLVTNEYYPECFHSVLETNIGPAPFAPIDSGLSSTNVTLTTELLSDCVSGSFYIFPTNACGLSVVATQLVQTLTTTNQDTNLIVSTTITNNPSGTNDPNATNITTIYLEFSQSQVDYFTQQVLVANLVTCPTNATAARQGVGQVDFVRRDYDSLFERFFIPVTNVYNLTAVTNNQYLEQSVIRVVNTPDFVYGAQDLDIVATIRSVPTWTTNTLPGLAGPGTIEPSVNIGFNKVGRLLVNIGPQFVDELSAAQTFIWGSYDGSTNDPLTYPSGTTIKDIENQLVIQLTNPPPSSVTNGAYQLPDATVATAYDFQLGAQGGQPPYQWSLSPRSAPLPPGLLWASDGRIYGTPDVGSEGTYDFSMRSTDQGLRVVDWPLVLTVQP